MELLADFGNSLIKLALYEDETCILQDRFDLTAKWETTWKLWQKTYTIERGILSNVGKESTERLLRRFNHPGVQPIKAFPIFPMKMSYKTPETLGDDRLALAAAARKKYPNRNVLVVDMGSCITYDFCSAEGIYSGGAISPGLEMRYKALHHFTGRLPALESQLPTSFQGDSTAASIHAGIHHGIRGEIEYQYHAYAQKHTNLLLILTGGDASILPKTLKNTIFAQPNFLFEGLQFILQLNRTT